MKSIIKICLMMIFFHAATAEALPDSEVQKMVKQDKDFAAVEKLINDTWNGLPTDVKNRLRPDQLEWIKNTRDKQAEKLIKEGTPRIKAYTVITMHRANYLRSHVHETIQKTGKIKEGSEGHLWMIADKNTKFPVYKAVLDSVKTSCDQWSMKDRDHMMERIGQDPANWETYTDDITIRWHNCDPHYGSDLTWSEGFAMADSDLIDLYKNFKYQNIPWGVVLVIANESYKEMSDSKYERLLHASKMLDKWLDEKKEEEIFMQKAMAGQKATLRESFDFRFSKWGIKPKIVELNEKLHDDSVFIAEIGQVGTANEKALVYLSRDENMSFLISYLFDSATDKLTGIWLNYLFDEKMTEDNIVLFLNAIKSNMESDLGPPTEAYTPHGEEFFYGYYWNNPDAPLWAFVIHIENTAPDLIYIYQSPDSPKPKFNSPNFRSAFLRGFALSKKNSNFQLP